MADVHFLPQGGAQQRVELPQPHNTDVEMALLGALLSPQTPIRQLMGHLQPDHFAEPVHGLMYRALVEMAEAGRPITVATLKTYLPETEVSLGLPLFGYVARCVAEQCAAVQVVPFADEVIDLHARRQLVAVGREIMENAVDPPVRQRADEMIANAESALTDVRRSIVQRAVTHSYAAEAAAEVVDFLHAARDGHVEPTGFPTGLGKLDAATGGVQRGDLWIIGGRPGMGKTTIGTTIARGVAEQDVARWRGDPAVVRTGSVFYSFEVSKRQITARILADMAYLRSSPFQDTITFGDILRGRVTEDSHLWRVENAAKRLGEMPLRVDWSSRLTLAQIGSRVRAEKSALARRGCRLGVVVLDYLKMIQATERYRGQRNQEVAEISGGLKQMAKDEDVGVVLLCQLNRQNELRGDPVPQLADLKESGDLEADADVVAFVYRPEYYLKQSKGYRDGVQEAVDKYNASVGRLELILAKNRAGSPRTLELFCDIASSAIDDRDRRM